MLLQYVDVCMFNNSKQSVLVICPHISVFAPYSTSVSAQWFQRLYAKVQGKLVHKDMHTIVFQSTVSNVIVQINIVWYIFETRFETKIFESWTKATLLRIYFRNLSVHRSFLQYKSQSLEKVNIKYVIKRLWHKIFHIVPGINPRPISALQLRSRAWYGILGLIPGPIWKISCNNLLILYI